MIDNPFTHFIAFLLGVLCGVMMTMIVVADARKESEAHHRDAYDAHGNLICEFCKALVEKGSKNGK